MPGGTALGDTVLREIQFPPMAIDLTGGRGLSACADVCRGPDNLVRARLQSTRQGDGQTFMSTTAAVIGCAVMAVWAAGSVVMSEDASGPATSSRVNAHSLGSAASEDTIETATRPEWTFGGYGGVAYTQPATLSIRNGDQTDVRVRDFEWIGKPFKAPVYYGARIQRWTAGRLGGMLDFTHAKAIAQPDDIATFEGQHNGVALPNEAPIEDVFSKLEFSHGHNMLTLNGLVRLAPSWARVRPYFGVGGGVSLPHTEIGFRSDNVRTYEYQYAGMAAQGLAGVEVQLGRVAVFLEYKFTYAPYDVPLTHRSPGWLLVTDIWEQIKDWFTGREPPGGRLDVQLNSHHAIAGVLVKSTSPMAQRE